MLCHLTAAFGHYRFRRIINNIYLFFVPKGLNYFTRKPKEIYNLYMSKALPFRKFTGFLRVYDFSYHIY